MSKIYVIYKLFHNDGVEAAMNWPYIDNTLEKIFASRKDAEKWVNAKFTSFLNEDHSFYDLQIVEEEIAEEIADEAKGAPAIGFWVSAKIAATVRGCKAVEMEFIRKGSDNDFKEREYWVDSDFIRVFYKLPPFCTRTEVVEFIEKKGGEFIKKKK